MSRRLQAKLASYALRNHPHEAAQKMEGLDPQACARFLSGHPPEVVGATLLRMTPLVAARILAVLSAEPRRETLLSMSPVIGAQLLRRLPKATREDIVQALPVGQSRRLRSFLRPASATAEALADPDVLTLFETSRIQDALRAHREALIRTVHDIPVLDAEHRLVGMVSPGQLLAASKDETVGGVMRRAFATLPALAGLAQIAAAPAWRSTHAMPVVNPDSVFLGVVHYESFRWVEQQLEERRTPNGESPARALGELFATAIGGLFEAVVATTEGARRNDRIG